MLPLTVINSETSSTSIENVIVTVTYHRVQPVDDICVPYYAIETVGWIVTAS